MRSGPLVLVALLALPRGASALVITVTPGDDYSKLEAAGPGDVVEIAPGTYKFRVHLTQQGTAQNPIIIRAQDPSQRPVWDLAGQPVSAWPGSYTAGDRGRGCWQVTGDHYRISGIEFRNCQDSASAGLRAINSGPLTVRDCVFVGNTNGLTGSSSDLVVEFSEFFDNGRQQAGSPSHNIYIYGGKLTVRYSYLHDPTEGQNFHVRAADALIEYCWITRPASYPGDVMSCEYQCGGSGSAPITQRMTLRGNVIVQATPANLSQIIALYNDAPGGSSDGTGEVNAMELTLINNTIVGSPLDAGKTQRLVNMRNDSVATTVHLHNNIIYELNELAVPQDAGLSNWSVDGSNNWISSTTVAGGGLSGTISGGDPGWSDAASADYTLAAGSACLGAAAAVPGLPDREYYRDELVKLMYRLRASATDLGAFEQGTSGAGIGPYGSVTPTPDAGPAPDLAADAAPPADGAADAAPTADGGPDVAVGDGGAPADRAVDGGPAADAAAAADAAGDAAAGGDGGGRELAGGSGCSCSTAEAVAGLPAGLALLLLGLRRAGRGPAARRG